MLTQAGAAYAGNLAVDDPLVSPIYGTFQDLGELLVISGTDEILYPDVLRLKEKVANITGTTLSLIIVPDMMHDFVVYPLRESLPYIDEMGEFFAAD